MKQVNGWWDADLSPHLEVSVPAAESLDVIVDSGFNGELMLPLPLIKKLGLKRRGIVYHQLADGSTVGAESYAGEILWFGDKRRVSVQSTEASEGLLGTELFQGCKVEMDADEGIVTFRKKTSRTRKGSTTRKGSPK